MSLKPGDTVVMTYIYGNTPQTGKMMESVVRLDLPVCNAFKRSKFMGNGYALRDFVDCLECLKETHKYVIYSDGGDTFFTRGFTPPPDRLIYSTEKACYPRPELAAEYPAPKSPWRFLNGGNWCAPIPLALEFFKKYKLDTYKTDINGQYELAQAYLKAIKEGFPIELDEMCEYFQTIAFEERGDFRVTPQGIQNLITNTYPAVFHGNGRTDMDWIYKLYEKRT
jgi:hypothetical protein